MRIISTPLQFNLPPVHTSNHIQRVTCKSYLLEIYIGFLAGVCKDLAFDFTEVTPFLSLPSTTVCGLGVNFRADFESALFSNIAVLGLKA